MILAVCLFPYWFLIVASFTALLTSKCAVNNTAVIFHCENAYSWRVNFIPSAIAETQENISITADLTNELNNGSVSLIHCISRTSSDTDNHYAVLAITGEHLISGQRLLLI